MPTTVILVRHCEHELQDRLLIGRQIDAPLSTAGARCAERLAPLLAGRGVTHLLSSPRFRALQTARPLAGRLGRGVEIAHDFDEIDFGRWSGRSFEDLQQRRSWQRWNSERGSCRPPGGESMHKLQARVLRGLHEAAAKHPQACIAVFTHAEPVRAAILHFRRIPLDEFFRVEVAPGSLTTFALDAGEWTLLRQNERADELMAAA